MTTTISKQISKQPIPDHAEKVFSGTVFDVYQWQQKMYDGSYSTFEKLKRADTVVVIPVTQDSQIILIEEEQPEKKPFLGIPGGRVEQNEDVLEAAKRELLEETGFSTGDFELWGSEQPFSKIEWAVYTFIAKGCVKNADLKLDVGEKIKLRPVSFEEFVDLVCE